MNNKLLDKDADEIYHPVHFTVEKAFYTVAKIIKKAIANAKVNTYEN